MIASLYFLARGPFSKHPGATRVLINLKAPSEPLGRKMERVEVVCPPVTRSLGLTYFTNHAVHDLAVNLWADVCSFSDHHSESSHQLLLRIRLQKITSCTCAKGGPHQVR
jgi:DNA mismatch repair protein MutH